MEDVYTIADLSRKTGLSQAKIKSALKGVEPAMTISDGYYKLYSADILRDRLLAVNADLLTALSVLARPQDVAEPEESE
jgi:hypothetical protein